MPNWNSNTVRVSGEGADEIIARARKFEVEERLHDTIVGKLSTEEYFNRLQTLGHWWDPEVDGEIKEEGFFGYFVPIPEGVKVGEWICENWDNDREACYMHVDEDGTIHFDSANGWPEAFYRALLKKYPKLKIEINLWFEFDGSHYYLDNDSFKTHSWFDKEHKALEKEAINKVEEDFKKAHKSYFDNY